MRKGLLYLGVLLASSNLYAATDTLIWGKISQQLPNLKYKNVARGVLPISSDENSDYNLKPVENSTHNEHVRYQLTYKNIPIFGYQIIIHKKDGTEPTVSGNNITNIEQDLPNIIANITKEQAEKIVLPKIKETVKHKNAEKVIFIDEDKKAHLAWHLSFYTNSDTKPISAPNYLIDAKSGKILKHWDEVKSEKIGQGLGGNAFKLPYRSGMFQHGDALPGLPSLGKFDVELKDGHCLVQNSHFKVINLENAKLGYGAFPITVFDEMRYQLNAFSYACDATSLFLNYSDGLTGPVNYSFSPVNDTMYFAQKTLEMYQEIYDVKEPLGDDLPVRAYTHLGAMDNAFAIPTIKMLGITLSHQQIVIGNGDFYLTAPVQSVIAHELSHNFTEFNSGLLYDGQSGGINEAFSDMAAIALQDYISKDYPWYWDGKDWGLGREAMIGGEPLRFMDDPTKDGASIGHANDYQDDMDTHYSSGVFNKAFYLLSNKPGYSIQKAFQLMVDANQNYWSPIAYFDFAACGVVQSAIDRKWDMAPVTDAFAEVGVVCPLFDAKANKSFK